MRHEHLWKVLVERGSFPDRKTATAWIMSGKVLVKEQVIDKAGQLIPVSADIRIKGLDKKYVGRGGLKLEGALEDFELSVNRRVILDAGASHGGFTDCLIKHGAKKVYAVDVGFGQLAGSLRADSRVVNLERTNIADAALQDLDPVPDLATVDLSYLSLSAAIPLICRLISPNGLILCLVKPLFEIEDKRARRTGKIDGVADYRDILNRLIRFVYDIGHTPVGVSRSRISGNGGTREFFMLIQRCEPNRIRNFSEKIAEITALG